MGKKSEIDKLTSIIAGALRHKIGALVGRDEIYAKKYMSEFSARLEMAKKIAKNSNFNSFDRQTIKSKAKYKLKKELEERPYIDDKKYELMDDEIEQVFEEIGF